MNPEIMPEANIAGASRVTWSETHADLIGPGRRLLSILFYFVESLIFIAISAYPAVYILHEFALRNWIWLPIIMFVIVVVLALAVSFRLWFIEPIFEFPSCYRQLKPYPGYYAIERDGFASYLKLEATPLQAMFWWKAQRRKNAGPTTRVDANKIQGFVVMTESEWMGISSPPPSVPSSFVILVDLGDGDTRKVCRHFGHKADVVRLHGLLTKAFVTERPRPTLRPVTADDPI